MDICPKIILRPDGDLTSLAKAVSHVLKTLCMLINSAHGYFLYNAVCPFLAISVLNEAVLAHHATP